MVFDSARGLALAAAGYDELEELGGGSHEQGGEARVGDKLDAGNGLFGFVYDALLGTSIVDKVTADYSDSAVGKADSQLREVIEGGKGRNLTTGKLRLGRRGRG